MAVLNVDWSKVSALLPPDDDEVLWDSPGPPPHISGSWLIFAEGSEAGDAELLRVKEFLATVLPYDISGTQPLRMCAPASSSWCDFRRREAVTPSLSSPKTSQNSDAVNTGDRLVRDIGARIVRRFSIDTRHRS
jgi:hypothetical protein